MIVRTLTRRAVESLRGLGALLRAARVAPVMLLLASLVPVVLVSAYAISASRDIVYWDEVDTVIAFLLRLHQGLNWDGFLREVFAINNEHRMVTSRLMFAASWWLVGTVDFRIISAIGNSFLIVTCAALVVSAGSGARKLRMAVLLAFLMFQLEHFENFLWSGSSIDHFQVVALAVGAFVALARGTGLGLGVAVLLSVLATFTLAHGMATWPIGAFLLWQASRPRACAIWCLVAVATAFAFFHGFEVNAGHHIAGFDAVGLAHIARFWLALVGAPAALGSARWSPVAGIVLVGAICWLASRRAWRGEWVSGATLAFALAALALVALGRSELNGGQLHSRYMVLSALAWVQVLFVGLQRVSGPDRPYRALAWALPALAVFNVVADQRFLPQAESFVEGRDRAALRFKQYGHDGKDAFRLYPVPERGSRIINEAAQQGIYRIPRMCEREEFRDPKPSGRIQYFVDEMTADTRAIYISGWAAIPDQVSRRGELYLVLRSPKTFIVYSTVSMSRPDVAAANNNPQWRLSGFQFAVARWRLPPEELQLGILVKQGKSAEYIMTDHRIRPFGRGEAVMAVGD